MVQDMKAKPLKIDQDVGPMVFPQGNALKAKTQADAEHSEVLELKSARDEMRNQLERSWDARLDT